MYLLFELPSKMAKVAARGEIIFNLYGANVVAPVTSEWLSCVIGASAVIGDFSAEKAPRRGKVVVETFPAYPSSHAKM